MARVPDNEVIYKVFETFKQRCLIEDSSFLWPDRQIWTVENLQTFWDAFVGHPDNSNKSFIDKWAEQLESQSEDVIRIAADVTAFYGLFPSTKSLGTAAKTRLVEQVITLRSEMGGPDSTTWNELVHAFQQEGVGSTGTHYNTGRPFQMAFYLGFALHVKKVSADLGDWRSSRDVANQVRSRVKKEYGQTPSLARNIILHLLFPEYFEDTASDDQKRRMFAAFRKEAEVSPELDIDEGIHKIRQYLTPRYGAGFSFYDPEIREIWDDSFNPDPQSVEHKPKVDRPIHQQASELIDLRNLTFLSDGFLLEVKELLETKRQVIFEGPPGSGKTFVAEKFARWFTGQSLDGKTTLNEQVAIVQFHQSYGYEDFVQGIRPETNDDGQLVYKVRDGIFLTLVERALANQDKKFVLIIDEINRGNLSRIFGELLLLLEYRGMSARLPYGSGDAGQLSIPENLYIIGTMNTADRSLAQIDYALRRRFYFVRFMPVENGRAEVFENWLARNVADEADRARLTSIFVNLNHGIRHHLNTDDLQVGHSYFMQDGIESDIVFERVWIRAVRPLLEEYLHHHRNRDEVLAALAPSNLRPAPTRSDPAEEGLVAMEAADV